MAPRCLTLLVAVTAHLACGTTPPAVVPTPAPGGPPGPPTTPPPAADHGPVGDAHGAAGGHGAAAPVDPPLTCENYPHGDDLLSVCMKERCESPVYGNQTKLCLSKMKLSEYPKFDECNEERCICAFGYASWNCTTGTCTSKCEDCAGCYTKTKFGKNCEAGYRLCTARRIVGLLRGNKNFEPADNPDCKNVEECVLEASPKAACVKHLNAPDLTAQCRDDACFNSDEVEELLVRMPPLTCPHAAAADSCAAHAAHAPAPYNIIVLTAMVALGNLCRHFGSVFPLNHLPYTVQVFLIGAAWGALCKGVGGSMVKYGQLGEIDPHLLFYVFLPVLIFESAFATDYHVFKEVKVHCIFLAGPGLIICSVLTALSSFHIFTNYGWSFVTCLLFGVMLSATDPVAVVALLKELGAAPAISQLIEGESLLNDGTAIVFFNILKDSVVSGVITLEWWEILGTLVKVAGGGSVLGLLVGVIAKTCIKAVFNDPEIEITLTLVAAYATFFAAEEYFKVSGVLGLVVLGMYLAYHSHVISPEVEHSLHHFWEIVVYLCNTMIFCIAGLVITEKALDDLEGTDGLYLLVNYLILNVVRGLALAILMWPMNKMGVYQLDWKNGVLCTWGGLRGAVGLALALIIAGDQTIKCADKKLGSRFLFHVAGIVVLTLCVNGVTTGWIVSKLGLSAVHVSRQRATERAHKELRKYIDDGLYEQGRDPVYRDANWTKVREAIERNISDPHAPWHDRPNGLSSSMLDSMEDACRHYYSLFAHGIEHEYEAGTMRPSSLRVLQALLAEAEADSSKGGWRMIQPDFLRNEFEGKGTNLMQMFQKQDLHWVHSFDVGIGFLTVHEYVLQHIDGVCYSQQAVNKIKDHCKIVRKETIHILERNGEHRPEIASSLKSRNAARDILNKARHFLTSQVHKGKVASTDANMILAQVEANMKNLSRFPKTLTSEANEAMLIRVCPWYVADESARVELQKMVHWQRKEEKYNFIGKARDGEGCFVLLSGVVRVHIGARAETFGPGYLGGIMSVLTGKLGKYTEVFAETNCQIAHFDIRVIRDLCQRQQKFSIAIWDACCKIVARKVLACHVDYSSWSHVKLKNFAENGKRHAVQPSESYPTALPQDSVSILVSGEFKDVMQGRDSGQGPCIIPKHLNAVFFTPDSVLFVVKNPLSSAEKAQKNWAKIRNKIFTVRAIACLQGHEAGIRAVREVLEGRMTSMFARLNADSEPAAPTPTASSTVALVPASAPHSPQAGTSPAVSSAPLRSPSHHPSPHPLTGRSSSPTTSARNGYTSLGQPAVQNASFPAPSRRESRALSRVRDTNRGSRKYDGAGSTDERELTELRTRLDDLEKSAGGIQETTPWFSQGDSPRAGSAQPRKRASARLSDHGGRDGVRV